MSVGLRSLIRVILTGTLELLGDGFLAEAATVAVEVVLVVVDDGGGGTAVVVVIYLLQLAVKAEMVENSLEGWELVG